MQKLPKHLISLIAWIALVFVAMIALPDMTQLIHDKGKTNIPSTYESEKASRIAKREAGKSSKNTTEMIVVYNSNNVITKSQENEIAKRVKDLQAHKQQLRIASITAISETPEATAQLRSKNKKTQMILVDVKGSNDLISRSNKLRRLTKVASLSNYVTGEDLLSDVFSETTEQGIQKTEIIAAVFIFVVLVLVFRSLVIPFISLLTVGISLIVSLSAVMNLAQYLNLPISDFTQVFLVVVLFGIGTDYNILLYDKFKEELAATDDAELAATTARKTAVRTMLYSGISVLIGFLVLGLAKFSFYQSAVGVAVGVAVLLAVLLTLNIFFMSLLGRKMFWPSRQWSENTSNKLWHGLSRAAIARPALMMITVIAFGAAFFATNTNQLNFNTSDEVPNTNQAKIGYLKVQKDFSKGMAAPTTLYIENKSTLATQENLGVLDELTKFLKKETSVKQVLSVTQPTGKPIKALYLNDQLKTLLDGLNEANTGLNQIKSGLVSANSQIKDANVSDSLSQVQSLASGSQELASGTNQYTTGVDQYVSGSKQVNSGIAQLQSGSKPMTSAISEITSGSNQLQSQMQGVSAQVQGLSSMLSEMMPLLQIMTAGDNSSPATLETIKSLPTMVSKFNTAVGELNSALNTLNSEVPTFTAGINQVASGSNELVTNGRDLTNAGSELNNGTKTINAGIQSLNSQLKSVGSQVIELQDGLGDASTGIDQIQTGLKSANSYLAELKDSYLGKKLYVPQATLKDHSLKDSLDTYTSSDRKITHMTVVLNIDPSSQEATKIIKKLQRDMKAKVIGTSLANAKIAFGGQSAYTADLQQLSSSDFMRTVVIMIIGIGLALVFITRSILQPAVIISTLLIAYYAALGITRFFSSVFLGHSLLTWNTPFFSFIMLVALGVDYSIFLMMRYRNELPDETSSKTQAILSAATVIGTVVISAVIILSGTFAALIPSGVMTLIQVAISVIVGLIIILIALPIMISAYIKLTYKD